MHILNIQLEKTLMTANKGQHNGYQGGLPSMVYKFFYKKVKWIGVYAAIKTKVKLSQQLADELHKPIIRNIKKT